METEGSFERCNVCNLFQSFPRKGMETTVGSVIASLIFTAFSIISPQGDGNCIHVIPGCAWNYRLFQSFPRKGMETNLYRVYETQRNHKHFFNHFPARGWKQICSSHCFFPPNYNFFNHFPARGWKRTPVGASARSRNFFNHFPARGWKQFGCYEELD